MVEVWSGLVWLKSDVSDSSLVPGLDVNDSSLVPIPDVSDSSLVPVSDVSDSSLVPVPDVKSGYSPGCKVWLQSRM